MKGRAVPLQMPIRTGVGGHAAKTHMEASQKGADFNHYERGQ